MNILETIVCVLRVFLQRQLLIQIMLQLLLNYCIAFCVICLHIDAIFSIIKMQVSKNFVNCVVGNKTHLSLLDGNVGVLL